MSAVQTRTFELVSTVLFQGLPAHEMASFAAELSAAVGTVLSDYPSVIAYAIEHDPASGGINFGLRFSVVDTTHVEDMATEILQASVLRATHGEGSVEAEREESVLVLA